MINTRISTDKDTLDLKVIHDYLSNRSYWAMGRDIEVVKCSIDNSLCFGMYDDSNKLIGFARVLTDNAVFAYIMDLFILEKFRQQGLGKRLMDYIISYPDLLNVKRIMLATKDAHGLYERCGFSLTKHADKLMELVNN
jgi:GNAT superfamily N-acetyltransferase